VRREDNENGALAKSAWPRVVPVTKALVVCHDAYRFEGDALPEAPESDYLLVNLWRAPRGRALSPAAVEGLFVGLSALFTFLGPTLLPDLKPLHAGRLSSDAAILARREGVPGVRVDVQDVHQDTTAPNAESTGLGPTRRVILWDTLFDHNFSRREIDAILAHEYGHLAHHHLAPEQRIQFF